MNRYRWDPRLVGQRYFPPRRRSRCGSVPITRYFSKGRTSGSLDPPRRRRFSCSPYKPTSYTSQQWSSLEDFEATDKDMKVPSTSDAHILDHMRCSCTACMSFACKWRHLMKDEYRRQVKGHLHPCFKPHRKTSFNGRRLKSRSCTDNFRKKNRPAAQRDSKVSWWFGNYDPDSATKVQDVTSPESSPLCDKPHAHCFNNSGIDLSAHVPLEENTFSSIDRSKNRKVTWDSFNDVATDGVNKDSILLDRGDDLTSDGKRNDDFLDYNPLTYTPKYDDWYYPSDTFTPHSGRDIHWYGRSDNYDFTRPTDTSCNSVAESDDHYGLGKTRDFGGSFSRRSFSNHAGYTETGLYTNGVGSQSYPWNQSAFEETTENTRDLSRPRKAQTITLHNPGALPSEARLRLYKVQDAADGAYRAPQKEDNLYCTHVVKNGQYKAAHQEDCSRPHFNNEIYKTTQSYDYTTQCSSNNHFRPTFTQRDHTFTQRDQTFTQRDQSKTGTKHDQHTRRTPNDATHSEDGERPSRFSSKFPGQHGRFARSCRARHSKEEHCSRRYAREERYATQSYATPSTPSTQSDFDESSQLDSSDNLRSNENPYAHHKQNVHSEKWYPPSRNARKHGADEVRVHSDDDEPCHHHHYHHHLTDSFPRALRLNYDFGHRNNPSLTRDYRRSGNGQATSLGDSAGRYSRYDRSRRGRRESLDEDSQTRADKHGDHGKSSIPAEPKSGCKVGDNQEEKQNTREEPIASVDKNMDDSKANRNRVLKKKSLDYENSEMPVRRFSIDREEYHGERPSLHFDRAGTFIITDNEGGGIPRPGQVNASNHKSEHGKQPLGRLSKKVSGPKKNPDQKKGPERNDETAPKHDVDSANLGGRLVDLLKTIIGQDESEEQIRERKKNGNDNKSSQAYRMSERTANETYHSARLDDTRQTATDVDVNSMDQFEEETYVTAKSSLDQGRSRGNAPSRQEWHSKSKKESPERMTPKTAPVTNDKTKHSIANTRAFKSVDSRGQSSKCQRGNDEKPIRIDNVLRRSALKQEKKKRARRETHRPDCKSLGNKNLNRKSSSWDEFNSDESDSALGKTQKYMRPFRRNAEFWRVKEAGTSSRAQSRPRRADSSSLSEEFFPTHVSRREKPTASPISPSRPRDIDLTTSTSSASPQRGAPCITDAHRQRSRQSPSTVSPKRQSLCASEKVLSDPVPRSEDEWFNKHSSLMSECTRERQANAQARVERMAHRTQALKDSMGVLSFDFGEMEKRLDKVRDLQHDYLARADRAVRMVRKQHGASPMTDTPEGNNDLPIPPFYSRGRGHFSSPECQRSRGEAGDTRLNTRLQGTSSDGKLYRHRNLDELYSYFITDDGKTDSESPNDRSGECPNESIGEKRPTVTRRDFDGGCKETPIRKVFRRSDKINHSGNNIYDADDAKERDHSTETFEVHDFRALGDQSVGTHVSSCKMSELICEESSTESRSDTVSSTRRLSGYEPDVETDKERDLKCSQDPRVICCPNYTPVDSLKATTPNKSGNVYVAPRKFSRVHTEEIVAKIDKALKNENNTYQILLEQ